MSVLKACPFCGATEPPTIDMSIFNQEQGGCYHCEVLIDTDTWNTRPLEDAANARAEAAEARAAELQAALTAAINMNIEKNAEVAALRSELDAANKALAAHEARINARKGGEA